MTGVFPRRERDQRGVVFSSSVVMLSIVAVAMAGVAYLATRDAAPKEREVATTVAAPQHTATKAPVIEKKPKPKKPAIKRGKVYVEVYNNSNISGLAGRAGTRATTAGWKVVGTDNWYGTIPATTVYFPPRLKAAARQLALDLGVDRTAPAVDPMRGDRLTLILTEPLP